LVELRLQQYDYREIADQLPCSERTVRRILSRVKSRPRNMLDESIVSES